MEPPAAKLDAYLADHFAFRQALVLANMRLEKKLGGRTGVAEAVVGRDGWLFLTDGLLQSTGRLLDPAPAIARLLHGLRLQRWGEGPATRAPRFSSPSRPRLASSFGQAPTWAGPARRPTDYDRILAGVRRCGVHALDLRPVLTAAKPQGQLYRTTDSHWTPRGSLVGYEAIVAAMGRPDWTLPADQTTWQTASLSDGDLLRLAGQEARAERRCGCTAGPALRHRRAAPRSSLSATMGQPSLVETGRAGPTVLIVGDSFTADHFHALRAVRGQGG